MEDGKSFGAEKQGKPCRKLMNKFSSLSTSVLLALLTSSFSAAAYADGNDSLSRVPQRSNHDTMDRQQFAGTNLSLDKMTRLLLLSLSHGQLMRSITMVLCL